MPGRRTGQGRASMTGSYEVTFARPVRASRCSGSADKSQLRQPKRQSELGSDRVRAPTSHPTRPSTRRRMPADSSSLSLTRSIFSSAPSIARNCSECLQSATPSADSAPVGSARSPSGVVTRLLPPPRLSGASYQGACPRARREESLSQCTSSTTPSATRTARARSSRWSRKASSGSASSSVSASRRVVAMSCASSSEATRIDGMPDWRVP